MYNEQFTMSSSIWTKYIFESIDQDTGQDQIECGVRCEIADTTCNFFLVASGKCHLGRYDYYGSGTVVDSNVPLTYHKQSNENSKPLYHFRLLLIQEFLLHRYC